ncbi:hypothetical protein NMY22_g7381 [Coprinellus aureogranulatus]|nr:hypothetical protein NMY22_g7381 [Coprinellus aureogranulatus]
MLITSPSTHSLDTSHVRHIQWIIQSNGMGHAGARIAKRSFIGSQCLTTYKDGNSSAQCAKHCPEVRPVQLEDSVAAHQHVYRAEPNLLTPPRLASSLSAFLFARLLSGALGSPLLMSDNKEQADPGFWGSNLVSPYLPKDSHIVDYTIVAPGQLKRLSAFRRNKNTQSALLNLPPRKAVCASFIHTHLEAKISGLVIVYLFTARRGIVDQGKGFFQIPLSRGTSHSVSMAEIIGTDVAISATRRYADACDNHFLRSWSRLMLITGLNDFPKEIPEPTTSGILHTILSTMASHSSLDMLVTFAHAIWATGEQGLRNLASVDKFVGATIDVISDQDSYGRFLDCRDGQAQSLVSSLYLVLRTCPTLEPLQQAQLRKALFQLCLSADLLPTALHLPEIADVHSICEAPNVDTYQGRCEGRVVCLKKYRCYQIKPEEVREIMVAEATVWSTLTHQNVVPLLGVAHGVQGPNDRALYLVTPSLQHRTIVDHLVASPNANRYLLLRDVIEGLSYLHSNHIVHGTIKGANILVTTSGRASIANVELSDIAAEDDPTWPRGPWKPSLGSIAWKAPELLLALQSEGPMPTPTRASDIYALACIAYEIFTTQAPLWHISPQARTIARVYSIIEAVLSRDERPAKPEGDSRAFLQHGLTAEIWAMMEGCWSRDPLLRPSAAELAALPFFARLVDERPMSADY